MSSIKKNVLFAVLATGLLCPVDASARRYPITKRDSSGTWVGTARGLMLGRGELWKRYGVKEGLPSVRVTDVELSTRSVWVATDKGLARLDKGSRRWERFSTPDLPSNRVTGVSLDSSDPDQVWVSTLAGLAHYNVRTNTWTRIEAGSGLPSLKVRDVLFRGRTVWAATDAGLAARDTRQGTWVVYTAKNGLAGARVLEIDEIGTDLWLTCDQGLSRMNMQRRTFSLFRKKEGLPGVKILAQARYQTVIYFVTEKGLITYDTAADALSPFLHAKGLRGANLRSVAAAGGFVWFATDKGLQRFEPTRKVWEYYTVEDGLSSDDLARLTVSGSMLLVFSASGDLDTYEYKKDEWMERSELLQQPAAAAPQSQPGSQPATQPGTRPVGEGEPVDDGKLQLSVSAELDTELRQALIWEEGDDGSLSFDRREGLWLFSTLRLGVGARWGKGRSIDVSGKIDWGDLDSIFSGDATTLETFQRYDLRLRYLGARGDWLREVLASDKVRLDPRGGVLTERTEVEGGRVVVALGPRRRGGRMVEVRATAGLRRGTPARAVFRGGSLRTLQNKRFKLPTKQGQYVIPTSVKALLDARELERNVDYFVDHDTGTLWIKNTDLVHTMRVLEVEFEYEQIPRKIVSGAVSLTLLLPKDGDLGQIKRSGQARWAKDERGLFDEIDGGAEQYINRGWVQTLSQDFEWGSAGVSLRIHDMADDKNAKAIYLARKLPDAKLIPGLTNWVIEKQAASISVKGYSGRYFIEITIDQPTMEQEIQSIAFWMTNRVGSSGDLSADALRDVVISTGATLRLSDNTTLGFDYLGTRSAKNADLPRAPGLERDVFASHASYTRSFARNISLSTSFQAAASRSDAEVQGRSTGVGISGRAMLTSPLVVARINARKYTREFMGIGVARQTEFCRDASGACALPGTSRLDNEIGFSSRVTALDWLPVDFTWQRQSTDLGRDYDDAPSERARIGVRDVALATVGLQRQGWPRLSLGGGYIGRRDALSEQDQLRATGAVEADLAEGWLRALKFKKLYLRGLYEYGDNQVDEYRASAANEMDRAERMHHAVGELRLAPTLTESGYLTLEYHGLEGVLDSDEQVVDSLTYWRLEGGAGSSIVPGLALRLATTIWFGDDMPLEDRQARGASLSTSAVEQTREQEADSSVSAVLDIFPGEWAKALSPVKQNVAYTYTEQSAARALRRGVAAVGKEQCDIIGDEDKDGLADCEDPDCAMADACLQITGKTKSHRVYGTLSWDTPGKLQVELFADARWTLSGEDQTMRSTRQEVRSYVTWRPIHPSPITLRFDVTREEKTPQKYEGITPEVKPTTLNFEPALEWRRRWSQRWWHLAKLSVSYNMVRDLPHIRTVEDKFGQKGDLERLDYDNLAITPSLEVRRRFDDVAGWGSFRPYLRASYKIQIGTGISSRIDKKVCGADDECLANGSESARLLSVSLGVIWVLTDKVFLDLDLNTSHHDCDRAPTGSVCRDKVSFTPHLLTTVRY